MLSIRNVLILALLIRYAAKKWAPRYQYVTISNTQFENNGAAPSLVVRGAR